jgi:glucans biosynthesis protein C
VGFFLLFVIGFVMVADDRVTAAVDRQWRWALALGVVAMAARSALWPALDDYADPSWQDAVVNWLGYQFGLWMVIVGLMGLFHRYADHRGSVYAYATEAAYPFYILHQTVIVLIAYGVVQWGVGIPLKFTVIAVTSFALTVAVYEAAVRRWGVTRPLFGMKPRRRGTP